MKMIVAKEAALAARERARKGKGSGRMLKAEQRIEDKLHADLVKLRAGFFPAEHVPTARAPLQQVLSSARDNSHHHAGGLSAPSGRPRRNAGGSGDGGDGGGDGGDDGGGNGGVNAEAADDGEPDPRFTHFYRVSSNQKAFNQRAAVAFGQGGANLCSATFRPNDVIKAGCDRTLIGVGACHIHAPHLYLGLPLPPCPRHGWQSVDEGRVKTGGTCPARRVYDEGVDEWVGGYKMICGICKEERDALAEELKELKEAIDEDDEEEVEQLKEMEAAVKASTYHYRSYNAISMQLYAERYAWCAA